MDYMNKDYNKEKYRQLLKYSEDLRKQVKFIAKESRKKLFGISYGVYSIKLGNPGPIFINF